MQGRLNPAKGYFRGFWSRSLLFRTFVTSSDFGIAAMKTHTVTVCSSRPPPGKWFGTRVLQKFVTASGNSLSDRRNSFNKSLVPCLVRWTIQHLSDLFLQNRKSCVVIHEVSSQTEFDEFDRWASLRSALPFGVLFFHFLFLLIVS